MSDVFSGDRSGRNILKQGAFDNRGVYHPSISAISISEVTEKPEACRGVYKLRKFSYYYFLLLFFPLNTTTEKSTRWRSTFTRSTRTRTRSPSLNRRLLLRPVSVCLRSS